jgi:hypothetical protein
MSQHDFNIENQGFPGFRSDLNNALEALVTLSSGATQPDNRFAYQLWADTSTSPPTLKIRNGTNDAWISVTRLNSSTNVSTPVITTQSTSDNSTNPASTAYVINRIANDAPTKTGSGASGTWGINITGTVSGSSTLGNIGNCVVAVYAPAGAHPGTNDASLNIDDTVAGSDLRVQFILNTGTIGRSDFNSAYVRTESSTPPGPSYNGSGASLFGTWRCIGRPAWGKFTSGIVGLDNYYWYPGLFVRVS